MPCTVLVSARVGGRPPLVAHSFDTDGGVDVALRHVPRNPRPPRPRPVHAWDENALPRDTGRVVGHVDVDAAAAAPAPAPTPSSSPRGAAAAPTLAYWEAASGIANEAGVMIAESTCSAIFRAEPAGPRGGAALLCYQELTRIALERCATARAAVETMGRLAVRHGFAGNVGSGLTGSAETLAVVDANEAWVLHVLPDDTGASAVFCAQRVPDGHAACVANMFIVRDVDLDDARGARRNFMLSENAVAVAERCGLYDAAAAATTTTTTTSSSSPTSSPKQPHATFDFTRIFSAGEARHRFYSGRRQWRALSLFAPDLGLDPWYDDLPDYPFSVAVGPGVVPHMSHRLFCRIMRDTYGGTPFDLSAQPAAGPFGATDRYDSANGCKAPDGGVEREDGAFERPIGTFRMAYSYVGSPLACSPRAAAAGGGHSGNGGGDGAKHHMLYFAPHVSQTAVYLPVLVSSPPDDGDESNAVPAVLRRATIKKVDRASAYWAFRVVKHTARGLPWNRCLARIQDRQQVAENAVDAARVKGLEDVAQRGEGGSRGDISVAAVRAEFDEVSTRIVAGWWALNDDLLLRFGDGWEYEWADDGTSRVRQPVPYPRDWLERNNFFRPGGGTAVAQAPLLQPPPPRTKLWTVEEKKKNRMQSTSAESTSGAWLAAAVIVAGVGAVAALVMRRH